MNSISDIIETILREEFYLPPEPLPDTIEYARWRDRRNLIASLDRERMEQALKTVFAQIPTTEGTLKAPLSDIADIDALIRDIVLDIAQKDFFPTLYKQVDRNCTEKNKNDRRSWFRGTPIEKVFDLSVGISIPEEPRFAGTWIVAPSGVGKTTLLHSLFLDDAPKAASLILMDSKGEFIEPIKRFYGIVDSLVVLEPNMPLALNPFGQGLHTVELLEYFFSSLLEAKMTALQSTLFRSCLQATLYHPNPSMQTFRQIMREGTDISLPPELADFFRNEFATKTYAETRQQIQWRLRLLLDNTPIGKMFSATTAKLDIGQLMDDMKIVVVNNSKALLGDDGAEFFGRFFLALILAAAQKRSLEKHKTPCYVYIDEAQSVIKRDEKIATILDECRSQKIALIIAHQRCSQLAPQVLDAVANCAVRYANSDDDASFLATKFRTTADRLRSLRRGQFQCYVRGLGSFRVQVEKPPPFVHMTDAEYSELRDRMKEYCEVERAGTYDNKAEHTATNPNNSSTDATKDW